MPLWAQNLLRKAVEALFPRLNSVDIIQPMRKGRPIPPKSETCSPSFAVRLPMKSLGEFKLFFVGNSGCLLKRDDDEWEFSKTDEALKFAQSKADGEEAYMEIFDESGGLFMILRL